MSEKFLYLSMAESVSLGARIKNLIPARISSYFSKSYKKFNSRTSKKIFALLAFASLGIVLSQPSVLGEPPQGKLGLFITGLSGDNTFKNYFEDASRRLRELLVSNGYQREELVRFSDSEENNQLWNQAEISRKENLRKFFKEISQRKTPFENAFIFIAGHANGRDEEAVLHLPGEDIVYRELMEEIDTLPAKQMIIVIATPQGMIWIQKLSRPGRVIVVGNGYREYDFLPMLFLRFFPAMFQEIPNSPKNSSNEWSQISLKDAFTRTQRKVRHWFQDNHLRMTERAFINANGDKKGKSLEAADAIIFAVPRRNSQHGKLSPSVP